MTNFGTTCSAGCVRLTIEDAKWIYYNVASGTLVEFYSDPNPGPLGKPSAMKISNNIECRDWDPTDTDENNPWNRPQIAETNQEISISAIEEEENESQEGNQIDNSALQSDNSTVENIN